MAGHSLSHDKPPASTVDSFLEKYWKPNGTINTDEGGELENIGDFRNMIWSNSYSLQTRAPE